MAALPPLSVEQLGKVLSDAPTSEALYDILSQYENEACLLFTDTGVTGDVKLLSAFYASFLISHLLTDQM
jgi:COP9 signalosome complex subunit 8